MRTLKTTAFRRFKRTGISPCKQLPWHIVPLRIPSQDHTPFFLVTGQEVVLPLSREWHAPALCPLGVTWREALWRCRVEVTKAHELVADENAKVQTSETSRLRPGNHVALRLIKAERQAEGV